MTDDEKYLWKPLELHECQSHSRENIKDIIACGFNVRNTFIFNNTEYMGHLYPVVVQVQRLITCSTALASFGFGENDNIGKFGFSAIQAAPAFSAAFPHIFGGRTNVQCLIPCAIDQDPYFRVTRDVAAKLKAPKCALIHSKFICSLLGIRAKMSASDVASVIYLTDTPAEVEEKIMKYAYSAPGNLEEDVAYQYLTFFLEDDKELEQIREKYLSGELSSDDIKKILVDVVTPLVLQHQRARDAVTEEMVDEFLRVREIKVVPPKPTVQQPAPAQTPIASQ